MSLNARDGSGTLRVCLESNNLAGSYLNTTAGFAIGSNSTTPGYTTLATNLRLGVTTKTGTYDQAGTTTITVTCTNHGLTTGDSVYLDFTSGTAVDAYFNQVTVTNSSTFTVTAAVLTTSGNVVIYPETQLRFPGVIGDGGNSFDHTVISERLYGAADDSELLIFKGNDAGTSIQDNIRLAATGDIYFQTGVPAGASLYGAYIANYGNTVASSTVSFLASGNVGIGTINPSQKLDVRGNTLIGAQVSGAVATPPYLSLGANYTNTVLRANCKIRLFENGTDIYGFGIGSAGDVQYHSVNTHQFYNSDVATFTVNSTGATSTGIVQGTRFTSTVATGTAPLTVSSTTLVTNLNADLLDGVDSTSYSRLVHTTAAGGTLAADGANTWTKIATFSTGTTQFADCTLILSITNTATSQHDSAIISVFFRSNATSANPTVDVEILSKGGTGSLIINDSFKVISGAWTTDMELWMKKGNTYGCFAVYETSKRVQGGTLTYNVSPAWQSATPTGAVNNVSTDGVYEGLKITSASSITGSQLVSTVATGTAPLGVASTTLVTNLNADLLDGKNTGTSGNTIPLLDGVNTWSSLQTFTTNILMNSAAAERSITFNNGTSNVYIYGNSTNIGMYDSTNLRSIWRYEPPSNLFVIERNTRFIGLVGLDAGQSLFFGREESFGGSDTGGADYGYITWDNDNNTYNTGGAGDSVENGCLRIGTENDGFTTANDNLALEPSNDLWLYPRGGRVHFHKKNSTSGGQNVFTGLYDPSDANGRGQFVLSSSYSDLVIASSQGNNDHGSTLTFATYNPSVSTEYKKFVINQGNWGTRSGYLDFGYSDTLGRINPHGNINATDCVMTLDGYNKRVGIGPSKRSPGSTLDVAGTINATSDISLGGELNFFTASNKYIDFYTDNDAGALSTAYLRLVNNASNNFHIAVAMVRGGAVELYHNNSIRLNTTSDGIRIQQSTGYWTGFAPQNNYVSASLEGGSYIDFRNELGIPKGSVHNIFFTNGGSELRFYTTASGIARGTDTRTLGMTISSNGTTTFPSTVTATTFSGALTGNATTATTLATARLIGGVSFNGSADITPFRANTLAVVDGGTIQASSTTYSARNASSTPQQYTTGVNWEFKNASVVSGTGNYAGLLTLAPWVSTTASTGDPAYQLAFSPAAANSTALPTMKIRAGIDATWGSWGTFPLLENNNTWSGSQLFTGTIGDSPTGTSGVWVGKSSGGDGSIQLVGTSPHIDFANATEDYDVRIARTGDNDLSIQGGNLFLENDLRLTGVSPTIALIDTNHATASIHVNSDIFYILRNVANTAGWTTVDNIWPLEISLTNNDARFGRTITSQAYQNVVHFVANWRNDGVTALASSYNYIMTAPNDTGNKLVMFVNSSTRTDDGGGSALTFRNDGGPLVFGRGDYQTSILGSQINLSGGSTLYLRNNPAISNTSYSVGNNHIELRTDNASNPIIGFHRSGYTATALYHAGYGSNSLRIRNADGNDGPIFSTFNGGAGSGLDADLFDGVDSLTRSASHRANKNITGGGTVTVDGSGNVLWSSRFIIISNGRGAYFSTVGYFDIDCPVTGTITGVGGAANVTATAAGIPLGSWQAIYYILPIGSGSGHVSVAANFRVASYTADLNVPHDWVLICVRNSDSGNGRVYFNNGMVLSNGQSMSGIIQDNANTANTLVRRDASGNFSAGTITATSFSGNASTATQTLASLTGSNVADLITATIADNDFFRVRVGGTATNAGFVEIATADDGNEPIYVRQYTGVFSTLQRTLTLLDGSGNTTVPGILTGTEGRFTADNAIVSTGTNISDDVWGGSIEIREINQVGNAQTGSPYAPGITFHWGNVAASAIKMYNDGSIRFIAQGSTGSTYRPIYANTGNFSGNITANGVNVGSGVTTGFYGDGSNLAVRVPNAGGGFFVQSPSPGESTWALFQAGGLSVTGTVTSSSDIKLKTNIKTIDNALDKVLNLRGVEFDRLDINDHQIGLVAQEVEKVIPDVVYGEDTKTVAYGNIVAVLIEAIKELKKEVDQLKPK